LASKKFHVCTLEVASSAHNVASEVIYFIYLFILFICSNLETFCIFV